MKQSVARSIPYIFSWLAFWQYHFCRLPAVTAFVKTVLRFALLPILLPALFSKSNGQTTTHKNQFEVGRRTGPAAERKLVSFLFPCTAAALHLPPPRVSLGLTQFPSHVHLHVFVAFNCSLSCHLIALCRRSAFAMGIGLPHELQNALAARGRHGEAHTGGPCPSLPPPGLHIEGVAQTVALPLLTTQAAELAAIARPAPHGKGLETVVDSAVRDCLELDPALATFRNRRWEAGLARLVGEGLGKLGVRPEDAQAELYKILLYKTGGHFKPHRDTEKTEGMFATLTVQLPSRFSGGEFVVRHKGKEAVYDGGVGDGSCEHDAHYSCFYADVAHELKPVKDGYRLALVYSLSWVGDGAPPSAEDRATPAVAEALKKHAERPSLRASGAWTLQFALDHRYTQASLARLGVGALKGADRERVDGVIAGAKFGEMGRVDLAICSLSRTDFETGDGCHYTGFDVVDTEKGAAEICEAYDAEGRTLATSSLGFLNWTSLEEVDSDEDADSFFQLEDEGEVEYTGNEGASRETTYSAMAVALWPVSERYRISPR